MSQSQVAANPWHKEEEERDTNQHTQNKQKQTLFPKRGDRNAEKTEKHKDKTQGMT